MKLVISLEQFLSENKTSILNSAAEKTFELTSLRPTSDELKKGIPIFFEQLIAVLKKSRSEVGTADESQILSTSGVHGRELMQLGYTISQVVHAYGAICQAITERASVLKAPITALEFHNMNRCLDIAIAGAVSEFEIHRDTKENQRELKHLGVLAHELRNSLNRAMVSYEMLSKGFVAIGGNTGKILGLSLDEMQRLIDQSLTSVRLRAESPLVEVDCLIFEIINQLVITAEIQTGLKKQKLSVSVAPELMVHTDPHLLISALGNLIQNAIKFTDKGGHIQISGKSKNGSVVIDIEDECGGIPPDKKSEIFKPFSQQGGDRSGLGLGLTISIEAIQKCGGTITVRNVNDGCCFSVTLPEVKRSIPISATR